MFMGVLLLFSSQFICAQQIQNGDFENGTTPTVAGQIASADHWSVGCNKWYTIPGGQPTNIFGSPDLYACNAPSGGGSSVSLPAQGVMNVRLPGTCRFAGFLGPGKAANDGESIKNTISGSFLAETVYEIELYAARKSVPHNGPQPDVHNVEIVLRKSGNCFLEKVIQLDGDILANETWTKVKKCFKLTQQEADLQFNQVEVRATYNPVNAVLTVPYDYIFVDDVKLTKICQTGSEMNIVGYETEELETPCGNFAVPVICQERINIQNNQCPIQQHMLSLWVWDPTNCTKGNLVYTSNITNGAPPSSFDVLSLLGNNAQSNMYYWVEWAVNSGSSPCTDWSFDYAIIKIGKDCCTTTAKDLQAWINDNIIGYQTVTSQTYGWSVNVPFICDPDRLYNFATNGICADVYTIKNSEFNTNTWTDINLLYSASGSGAVPTSIELDNSQNPWPAKPNHVNHMQIATASPYQVIDILWVPGCNSEVELPSFVTIPENENKARLIRDVREIELFPNPTTENTHVSFGENQTGTVSIVSTSGTVLQNTSFSGTNGLELPTRELSPGVYFVRISINGETITKKLIKK